MSTDERLDKIERLLEQLVTKTVIKSWYTVENGAGSAGLKPKSR